jgi:hypothetical protein
VTREPASSEHDAGGGSNTGAMNGKRRRPSSANTTTATAGTANQSVVRGASIASCLKATSSALSIAPTAMSRSKP